jgi:hypothetical protein
MRKIANAELKSNNNDQKDSRNDRRRHSRLVLCAVGAFCGENPGAGLIVQEFGQGVGCKNTKGPVNFFTGP